MHGNDVVTPPRFTEPPMASRPCLYYSDPSGCHTKDPAVVRFAGSYWMYYSQCSGGRWQIGIACSDDLLNWQYQGTINALKAKDTITCQQMAAPGARVVGRQVELFYQDYQPGRLSRIYHLHSRDGLTFAGGREEPAIAPMGSWNCGRAIDADFIIRGSQVLLYWATRDPHYKIQMQGASRARVGADYADPASWRQLSTHGPVLCPQRPTPADQARHLSCETLAWEGECIEAAATMLWDGSVLMFYGGGYNNAPQQIGAAISEDGVNFRRLNGGLPVLSVGSADAWNGGESGHPFVFVDDDGKAYLFYQGDNPGKGYRWRLSMRPLHIERRADGEPVICFE